MTSSPFTIALGAGLLVLLSIFNVVRAAGDQYHPRSGKGRYHRACCRTELHGICESRSNWHWTPPASLLSCLHCWTSRRPGGTFRLTWCWTLNPEILRSGHGILEALQNKGGDYAALYGQHNVAVTGTHAHSGPGAWVNYLLPQITSLGFNKPSYQALVDGAVNSIVKAHESVTPGTLSVGSADVEGVNYSRSPLRLSCESCCRAQSIHHRRRQDYDSSSLHSQ